MTRRAFGYLGAALAGAWLAAPQALEAQGPPARARVAAKAPALLSAPAVGQASPLRPDEAEAGAPAPLSAAPQPAALEPAAPQSAAQQPAALQPERLQPQPAEASESPRSQLIDDEEEVPITRQGQWTQWNDGRALWTCEFRDGKRHGKATRHFIEGEGPLFAEPLADGFKAPFESQAVFVLGKLDGVCTIVDNQQRMLCQLSLKENELEGESTWYYPSGQKREVVNHHAGRLEGKRLEYSPGGQLVKDEDYLSGRLTTAEIAYHESGQRQMRGNYFLAGPMVRSQFDWLHGQYTATVLANFSSDVRTGKWTWWHASGQPQLEGTYEEDLPTGTFTWWYPNGQKERQGNYVDGLQSGKWSWWFPSGQKQIEGFYVAGKLSGDWQFWREDGTLVRGDAAKLTARTPQQPAPQVRIVRQPQPKQTKNR